MADTLILVPFHDVRRRWDRWPKTPGPIEPRAKLAELIHVTKLDEPYPLIVTPDLVLSMRIGAYYQAVLKSPHSDQTVSVRLTRTGEISVHRAIADRGWTITVCYQSA